MPDHAFGWDKTGIDNPKMGGDFQLLPKGEYKFTVTKMERGRYEGGPGAKLDPCDVAILHMDVDAGELGVVPHIHKLHLHTKVEGMITEFFIAVGLHDPESSHLALRWGDLVTRQGVVKMDHRTYDGKQYNDAKKFRAIKNGTPAPAPAPAPAPVAAPPAADNGELPF